MSNYSDVSADSVTKNKDPPGPIQRTVKKNAPCDQSLNSANHRMSSFRMIGFQLAVESIGKSVAISLESALDVSIHPFVFIH